MNMKQLMMGLLAWLLAWPAAAQDYERQWKVVERAMKDDQPRTVVMEARRLYEMAEKKENLPQMLRAYLIYMSYRDQLSPDSFKVDRRHLEQWQERTKNAVDKSVLSLVLAANTEDTDAAYSYYCQALGCDDEATLTALANQKTQQYLPLVKLEKDSELYQHDMLSFLRHTALECVPYNIRNKLFAPIFKRDEDFYQKTGKTNLSVQVALEGWQQGVSHYQTIDEMIARYGEVDDLLVFRATQMQTYRREKEALEELRALIARFPNHRKVNQLKQMEENCIRPSLQLHQLPRTVTTAEQLSWGLHTYNVEQAELRWYKLVNPQALWQTYLTGNRKALQEAKQKGTLTDRQTLTVGNRLYEHIDTTFTVTTPSQPGYYLIEVKPIQCGEYPAEKANPNLSLVCVTDLMALLVPVDNRQWEVWSMNSKSGHPTENTHVQVFTRQRNTYNLVKQTTTNINGNVLIDKGRTQQFILLGKDKELTMPVTSYASYETPVAEDGREQQMAQLFTDRSLYRPGQTVQFSVMTFTQRKDETKVATGQELEVQLLQPGESKAISTVKLTTDEMGVAAGSFELPAGAKTGIYTLSVPQRTRCSIRVEEYKRPTFEVTWLPIEEEYALGDTITVTGRAMTYAGVPVAQAQVNLKTSYNERLWWRMVGSQELRRDTLYTDDEGYFACRLALVPPQAKENQKQMGWFNRFILDATVTSMAGESHDAQQTVGVSAYRFSLSLSHKPQECKENLSKWTASLYNSAGVEINEPIGLSIKREGSNEKMWMDSVRTGKEQAIDALRSLPSGRYVATVHYDTLAVDYPFTLFSLNDTKPVDDSPLWVYAPSEEMQVDQPLAVQYGTALSDAFVQVNVYNTQGRVHHEEVKLSRELRLWKLPCQTAWGDAVHVVFTLVKNGKVYQEQRNFQLAMPDKQLQAEWTSFRDQLQPGEQETWTLRLTKNGKPVRANLMASLYDASLDAIARHNWNFQLFFPRTLSSLQPVYNQEFLYYEIAFPGLNRYRWSELAFDRWVDNVPLRVRNHYMTFGANRVMMSSRAAMKTMATEEVAVAAVADRAVTQEARGEAIEEEVAVEEPVMEMRSNFAETAFFYPMLRTHANGEVQVQFTLPESLTRWRMMGFAHTSEMDYTLLYNNVTARKQMMVQPQLPRFLRVGDEAVLTATVQNLSDVPLQGILYVELTDSTLQQVVMKENLSFQVDGNGSVALSFNYKVQDLGASVVCRFYAKADGFSDGEQWLLPVLSDKVWLTENRAVYLNADKQQVDLSDMLHGGQWWNEHAKMTVETVHNPLWMVMETLEEQKTPSTNNAVDLAAAYYAASMANWLGQAYPALAEQKAFAVDAPVGAAWLRQLQELQGNDGGFSWFKGMRSSAYITRMVVEPFVRLRALHVPALDEARYETVMAKAMGYLDAQAIETYHEMQKWEKAEKKKIAPSENVLHYLYQNALLPHALTGEGQRAVAFFLERLPLVTATANLYDKALATLVFQKSGKTAEAKKNLQSLLEYTVYTEELGRYYDTKRSMVSWRNFRIPVQTLLMEVLQAMPQEKVKVDPEKAALSTAQVRRELCQWLLNQRRTQQWENASAVMDVLYALLLAPQSELKVSQTDRLYSKTEVNAQTSREMPKTWTVEREAAQSDSPMSWVSIAMTTYVPLDAVRPDNPHTGLHVERHYYVETVKDGETRYVPADMKRLQIGQKLVCRIQISADRDFDFVEISNQRAAALEPVRQLSGYEWHNGIGAYRSCKDSETLFYIDKLPKGEYELSETYFVSQQGSYQVGLTTAQGVYCPEFSDHTGTAFIAIPSKKKGK